MLWLFFANITWLFVCININVAATCLFIWLKLEVWCGKDRHSELSVSNFPLFSMLCNGHIYLEWINSLDTPLVRRRFERHLLRWVRAANFVLNFCCENYQIIACGERSIQTKQVAYVKRYLRWSCTNVGYHSSLLPEDWDSLVWTTRQSSFQDWMFVLHRFPFFCERMGQGRKIFNWVF